VSIRKTMLKDAEGAEILREKPRINSKTIDLDRLSKLPPESFGRTYYEFLKRNNVTPDSRLQVRFIKDPELAYVMQRYREIHDLVHTVTGQPTNMLGNQNTAFTSDIDIRFVINLIISKYILRTMGFRYF